MQYRQTKTKGAQDQWIICFGKTVPAASLLDAQMCSERGKCSLKTNTARSGAGAFFTAE